MGNKCFVICSEEQAYADGLALLLAKKIDFQIHVCSLAEQVERIAKEQGIEILLIDEKYLKKEKEVLFSATEIIILTNEIKAGEERKKIYKYQSADAILAEILSICLEDNQSGIFKQQLYRESCLIGIYSPIHRVGKTTFAIALGRELAKKERVLYLNLEEYSGWEYRYSGKERYTLADLLYYARQEKSNMDIRLGMMAGDMEGLEYIAPMAISQDLKSVTFEEWQELLELLLGLKIYKKIIIDFGESVQGLWKLLDCCQKIYMPVNGQRESYGKINQFEKNAELLGYEDLLAKIQKLEFENDMGSYVKQLLQKEESEK